MPPKNKKKENDDDAKFMRAARFGRVKNDLKMGETFTFIIFHISLLLLCTHYDC